MAANTGTGAVEHFGPAPAMGRAVRTDLWITHPWCAGDPILGPDQLPLHAGHPSPYPAHQASVLQRASSFLLNGSQADTSGLHRHALLAREPGNEILASVLGGKTQKLRNVPT